MDSVSLSDAALDGPSVELTFDDGCVARFHPVWLRDACRCSACRQPATMRRVVESMSVPVDLAATSAALDHGGTALRLTWPDGHETALPAHWLRRKASGEPTDIDDGSVARTRGRTLWTADLAHGLPWMDFADVIGDDAALLRWLETIDDLGFALFRGMPSDRATMNELAHRVGPVRASNYGVDWEIEATVTPKNAVYGARALSAHTDLPYRERPPGLQFLLADVADAPGGASLLVDGYRVAEDLLAEQPDMWSVLTEAPVPFTYVDENFDIRLATPIIGLRTDGAYDVIRHAPGLLGPLDPSPDVFERVYTAIHRFTELLADPTYEIRVRLEPGELIVVDNHRVLHGRTAFDLGPGGRRHLLGCYIDHDDLRSRIRVLKRMAR